LAAKFNYKNDDLAELGLQLNLSPRHLRTRQIEGLENILDLIKPAKEYPYDWVCYHITGRRPHRQNQKGNIAGNVLVSDLTTMAEHITRRGAPRLKDLAGDYQTHDALSAELEVSTKTIRRWRGRGLLGVRAVGEDGVARLMFSTRAVDRFKKRNGGLVQRGASFKLLTDAEKRNIVDIARGILSHKRQKLHLVARLVAGETGRAVETVRYTLRQYDSAHPDQALFARDGEPVVSRRHLAIWRAHKNGESPGSIAKAHDCDAEAIHAVIREMEARVLKDTPIDYVDNALFHAPNADALILDPARQAAGSDEQAAVRVPRDLPPYLRALYDYPLLTREQEVDLFRRFNYLRFGASRAVERLDVYSVSRAELDEVRDLLDRAENIKNQIIQSNLRLVVSIAKRHVGRSDNLFEVISDGNISLMRAVEKFDFALGNKFSTYGSWAIMKNFARTVPEQYYLNRRYVTGQDEMLDAAAAHTDDQTPASDLEAVRSALGDGLDQLSERERTIVKHHFGLNNADGSNVTLDDLGRRFGVTKERIRQIEKRAIDKLRDILSPSLLEAFAQ